MQFLYRFILCFTLVASSFLLGAQVNECPWTALRNDLSESNPERTDLLAYFHNQPKTERLNSYRDLVGKPTARKDVKVLQLFDQYENLGLDDLKTELLALPDAKLITFASSSHEQLVKQLFDDSFFQQIIDATNGLSEQQRIDILEYLIDNSNIISAIKADFLNIADDVVLSFIKLEKKLDDIIKNNSSLLDASDKVALKDFLNLDEGGFKNLAKRSDDELKNALEAAKFERIDAGHVPNAGHSVARHGPDITDPTLMKRLTEGVKPDGAIPFNGKADATSTRFKSYADWLLSRKHAWDSVKKGKSNRGSLVDYNFPPGQGSNHPTHTSYTVILEYSNRNSMGEGFASIQGASRVPHPTIPGRQVWQFSDIANVNNGMNRVQTTIIWDNNEWVVVSHFPLSSKSTFDPSTGSYIPGKGTPHDIIN